MKVWIVEADHGSYVSFVAVATGDKKDIEDYYRDRCGFGPVVREFNVQQIVHSQVLYIKELKEKKDKLELELEKIKKEIG